MINKPLILVRVAVAVLFLIHGVFRIWTGIVDDFGLFFTNLGWPLGWWLAWAVTCAEIITASLLLSGRLLRLSAAYLIGQCLMGIVLVHWQFGWFVVGGGRNGMEYSVLLVVCLTAIIAGHRPGDQAEGNH